MKKILLILILLFTLNARAEVQTKPLTKEMKNYISVKFKPVKNKKLVLYAAHAVSDPNCKHSRAFKNFINNASQNKNLTPFYSFQKFDKDKMGKGSNEAMEKAVKFFQFCGTFCVVSLQGDWGYAPLGLSYSIEQMMVLPGAMMTLKTKK